MSRTYRSKNTFKRVTAAVHAFREMHSDKTGVTVLSTLKEADTIHENARMALTRHPKGTKAGGLRKELKGKTTVACYRDSLGVAEEQSSRLNRYRRSAIHSATALTTGSSRRTSAGGRIRRGSLSG